MNKYFHRSIFVVVLSLMVIGLGQPPGRAALDKPVFDPECLTLCQQLQSQCFFSALTIGGQKKCLAEYRHCIAHCK